MMSQKRQEEKDRQRSYNDYRVNLKAELEIRHLHEKIDYLISRQWQRLSEIQQVQIEMLHQAAGAGIQGAEAVRRRTRSRGGAVVRRRDEPGIGLDPPAAAAASRLRPCFTSPAAA